MKNMPAGFKPIGTVAVRGFELPKPDWNFWGKHYDVELWQAAALSLNINPDAIKDPKHFYINEYKDRLRLLVNWLAPRDEHPYQVRVMLCELAGRWSKVLKWQIPPELAALARHYDEPTKTKTAAPAAPAVKVATLPNTSPSGDDVEEQAPVADDHDYDETLADLFDPVPVEALAKMFMIDLAKWKKWQEKAKANGLIDARISRGMFNPYKAGVWFVRKGAEGWDDARLNRVLVNNLPGRSRDDAHLLTGGID